MDHKWDGGEVFHLPPIRFVSVSKRGSRFDQPAPSKTRDCQSGFSLLNFLESGFHGHPGSDDFALDVSEQVAPLVILIDGEFSRG